MGGYGSLWGLFEGKGGQFVVERVMENGIVWALLSSLWGLNAVECGDKKVFEFFVQKIQTIACPE